MYYNFKNLVFEGGGVLGIAYLGVLEFLYNNGILQNIRRVAGTSAGAITACLTSFSLSFNEMKEIADTLEYEKIPQKGKHSDLKIMPNTIKEEIEKIFGDIDCIYRLIKDYGWYSSEYFYEWIKKQINSQFNSSKKPPPYTFRDFKNPYIHINERPFLDLYIVGTDISTNSSKLFSYETTPDIEVAEAVRISMSIPLFFESIEVSEYASQESPIPHIFSDGGIMRNYPISLFDYNYFMDKKIDGINIQTLGAKFINQPKYNEINNLLEYIENLFKTFMKVQQDFYNHSPKDKLRSIEIDTKNISFTDFNITPNDATYNFLYNQGYKAAKNFF